ncbi:MAG: acetoacetate decarboxylase [Trueperaceae bacterium]
MSDAFSTPIGAPLVPRFPIRFRDTRILSVLYETEAEAVARFLPPPLIAASNRVVVHFYRMTDPDWFGPHFEFAVHLDALLPGSGLRGGYSPLLMLTTDGGMATGREIYGQPKKFGEPMLEIRGDLIVGVARRNGIDVATSTTVYKQEPAVISELTDLLPFTTNINYKVVPSVTGEAAIRQLTARSFQDVVVHECWRGAATVELRANAQFPIHQLPVLSVGQGFYWRADLTLPFGQVVHDYLRESEET